MSQFKFNNNLRTFRRCTKKGYTDFQGANLKVMGLAIFSKRNYTLWMSCCSAKSGRSQNQGFAKTQKASIQVYPLDLLIISAWILKNKEVFQIGHMDCPLMEP